MKIALHRRPSNPRPSGPPCPPVYVDPLTGRDVERELTFADIRSQPDPEWSRPTSARQQAWAQGRADAAFAELGEDGPAVRLHRVLDRQHHVLNDIERDLELMRMLVEDARGRGVV